MQSFNINDIITYNIVLIQEGSCIPEMVTPYACIVTYFKWSNLALCYIEASTKGVLLINLFYPASVSASSTNSTITMLEALAGLV